MRLHQQLARRLTMLPASVVKACYAILFFSIAALDKKLNTYDISVSLAYLGTHGLNTSTAMLCVAGARGDPANAVGAACHARGPPPRTGKLFQDVRSTGGASPGPGEHSEAAERAAYHTALSCRATPPDPGIQKPIHKYGNTCVFFMIRTLHVASACAKNFAQYHHMGSTKQTNRAAEEDRSLCRQQQATACRAFACRSMDVAAQTEPDSLLP